MIAIADVMHTYAKHGNYTITISVPQTGMRTSFDSLGVNVQGAPLTAEDEVTTDEETAVVITVSDLLANDLDPDPGDVVSFVGVDPMGLLGTLVDLGNGVFTYDPSDQFEYLAQGETATDSFHYSVVDPSGQTSTGLVVITIIGVNDAPVAQDDTRPPLRIRRSPSMCWPTTAMSRATF